MRIDRERGDRLTRVERSLTTGSELGAWKQGQHAGNAAPRRGGITSSTIHVQVEGNKGVEDDIHVA